jgi:hypothetical protein
LIIGRHAHQPELHLVENDVDADFIDFCSKSKSKNGFGFSRKYAEPHTCAGIQVGDVAATGQPPEKSMR